LPGLLPVIVQLPVTLINLLTQLCKLTLQPLAFHIEFFDGS
jgi:hypothetical protein